jgi:hypothetical protein
MICDIHVTHPATLSLALRLGRQHGGCRVIKFAFVFKRVNVCRAKILREGLLFRQLCKKMLVLSLVPLQDGQLYSPVRKELFSPGMVGEGTTGIDVGIGLLLLLLLH